MSNLNVGSLAPNFTLYDSDKNKVSLSDFKGSNLIIHFFPLAFTGVCTEQLCTSRDNMNIYNALNAKVLGISVDSIFTLDRFKKENNLQFPLLSDFNKEVSKSYNSLFEVFPAFEMKGVSKRAAFVIDKDGKIAYLEILATPGELPNFKNIESCLNNLK